MEQADSVAHEVTVPLNEGPAPAAWAGLQPPDNPRPLNALHNMLHEASVVSSHMHAYQPAVKAYASAGSKFFDAMRDFLASSGDPALYENRLTEDGTTAAQAAAAAATAVQVGQLSPDAGAAAGVVAAQAMDVPATPAGGSAFAAEAAVPGLPLMGAAGVSKFGLVLCPGVPNTAALGVKGGLTKVVPAELHLPTQHAALFSTEQQRALVHRGDNGLQGALNSKLMPTLQLWLDTFEECKVEHLRTAADKARAELDAAMAAVVQAEASHPLTTPGALTHAGLAVPRVLVRGSDGTMHTQQQAGGGGAAAVDGSGGGDSSGGLVAVPAVKERKEMYRKEQAETDATLSFELAEKVLRDRLRWLVVASAGIKPLLTSALAHGLRAAADMGEVGHAAGGTSAGKSRAPEEELLTPFPVHVLARLRGEHLPTLPDVVLSDQARLARWGQHYRAAMATEAAAAAAAAGAQMMAAAAGPSDAGSASSAGVGPAGKEGLVRTDEGPQGGVAAGTAAAVLTDIGKAGQAAAAGAGAGADAPAGPAEPGDVGGGAGASSKTVAGASQSAGQAGVAGGMRAGVERAAAESGLPLDLLAAAVAADVQEQEAAAVRATKGDLAWYLLHDASITVGKEQAVLLPEVCKAVGGVVPALLSDGHAAITHTLAQLSRADPASSAFDLAVLEVVEVLEHHAKVLATEVLPALSESDSRTALRSLARAYRRAAAAAPTRPHAWLLDTATGSDGSSVAGTPTAGRAGRWVSAAVGAAGRAVKAPVRAGIALADAVADAAHFGPSHTLLKA